MAIERIEPQSSHPLVWSDHTHRYIWAKNFCSGIVLDAACGEGYGGDIILSMPYITSYIGIDISDSALYQANKYFKKEAGIFIQADCQKAPIKTNSIDTIISFETLEHLDNPEKVVAEFSRIIKDNGLFIGSVPSIEQEQIIEQLYGVNPYHKVKFTREELASILKCHFNYIKYFNQSLEIFDFIRNEANKNNPIILDEPIPNPFYNSYAPGPILFIASKNKMILYKSYQHNYILHSMSLYQQDKDHIDYVKYIQNENQIKYDNLQKEATVEKENFNNYINEYKSIILELDNIQRERDNLIRERDNFIRERDNLMNEKNILIIERDSLRVERDAIKLELEQIKRTRGYRFMKVIQESYPIRLMVRILQRLFPKFYDLSN